jgi:hypothetical protein
MPKILRDTQKDCGKPCCLNDYRIQVLARGGEMIEQRAATSTFGTFPTWRSCLMMSVDRGEAEIICSFRVFRILTQLGHQ